MAFPLETTYLLAQLRASYLALVDTEGYAQKIIRPINIISNDGIGTGIELSSAGISESPPIAFNVGRHIQKALNPQSRTRTRGRKSQPTKKRQETSANLEEFKEFDAAPVIESASKDIPVKRKSIITTPNIVKFFKRDDSDSDDSIKTSIIQTNNLELIQEEEKTEDGYITDQGETDKTKELRKPNDSAFSIDSDFGVPVSRETGRIIVEPLNLTDVDDEDPGSDKEYDEYDEEDDDDDDSEADFSEDSSMDSAFTNIDDESLLDNSIILSSYGNISNGFLENPQSYTNKKNRTKRAGSNSLDNFSRISSTNNFKNVSLSQSSIASGAKQLSVPSAKSFTSLKRTIMTFDKINPKSESRSSNLSGLIQSKFRSTNTNPLSYYQFVNGENTVADCKSVNISIFFKGELVLQELRLNNDASIADCIGYILLNLTKLVGYEEISINPNHWRLELTDEDCDDYGEFGYLNRTRLLSSYNNPKYLTLSEVSKEQIKINEQQTPLSMEFKFNLAQLQEKRNSTALLAAQSSEGVIELQITVHSTREEFAYRAAPTTTIGQVLKEVCLKEGFDPCAYVFREFKDHVYSDGLIHTKKSPILQESTIIADLTCGALLMTDSVQSLIPANITYRAKSSFQAQITPSDFTLADTVLSVPDKKEVKKVDNVPNQLIQNESRLSIIEKGRRDIINAKQLEDLMKGKNIDLPTNLTLIYFKWKVWRKKPAILNKLERFFIIDGDYIWLTPPDEINNISNYGTLDNAGESHHHHLRFNNYYKTSLTKTNQFHITQIVKLKQYKKNPAHFRIVVRKQSESSTHIQKKYYLDAESSKTCSEIIEKLQWTQQVYNSSIVNGS